MAVRTEFILMNDIVLPILFIPSYEGPFHAFIGVNEGVLGGSNPPSSSLNNQPRGNHDYTIVCT